MTMSRDLEHPILAIHVFVELFVSPEAMCYNGSVSSSFFRGL
jgi:hypothetical protein